MGPVSQGTPHVIDSKQGSYAAIRWHGQSSPTTNLPAVTSSPDVLLDFAHTMLYLVGLLVGASNGGGGHGGSKVRADGEMPVKAKAAQSNATPSIYGLRRT